MVTYSSSAISFIIVQSLSLILLLALIIMILKSKPYFTKWTLFQICISAFGCGLTSLPLILMYGDDLMDRAFDTPLCIILQKATVFFIYPLEFFSCALAFYLWYALTQRSLDIEKRTLKYVSYTTWIFAVFYNGIVLISSSQEEHWGTLPGSLGCGSSSNNISIYGYIVSTSILDFLAVLMSLHSIVVLWKRQTNFSNFQNRRTAIRLGESVRLCTWCFAVVILTTLPLVPRAIQKDSPIHNYLNIAKVSSFSGALDGIILFLIFGTDKKAAFFLPCYYAPPEKVQIPQYSFPDEAIDAINLNEQLSQMSDAHLKKTAFDMSNNYWNNDESFTTSHEECNMSTVGSRFERERVQEYI